jgi:SAM-dependent methyltransferase
MPSLYERFVIPRLIDCACSQRSIALRRAAVVPLASGRTLEIGIGSGLNLPYYETARVPALVGVEPSAELAAMAMRRAETSANLPLEVLRQPAECLPYADASFDTVVCTFTLCSVADPVAVLREVRRVLRADGQFLFAEHGLSPDAGVARWQRRLEPLWKRLAGGCHLSRPVIAAIEAAGMEVPDGQRGYLPDAPRPLGWTEWGRAVPLR